ncbi:mucin-3A-like [Maniola jurtina]|uniref:mucin-3A-like n=1 Tax=Maniola jurtina TaxID=191418 RepID=UPI001E68647A|nr:mucin-3A-like [Maniola jurtina]
MKYLRRQYMTWVFICILGCAASYADACDQCGHEHSRKLDHGVEYSRNLDVARTTNIDVDPKESYIELYSNRHHTIGNPNYEDEYRDVANKQVIYFENDKGKQFNINNSPNERNIIEYINFKDGYGGEVHNYINTKDHQHDYIRNSEENNYISNVTTATTISLAGYDDQIINLMKDIQKHGAGFELLVYFYLYTNYSFQYIGYIFTNKKIFRDSILKYTHYFCLGHNKKDCLCLKNLEKPSQVQVDQKVNSNPEFNKIAYLDSIPGKDVTTEPEVSKFDYTDSAISEPKVYYPETQSLESQEFILAKERDTNLKDIYEDVTVLSEGVHENNIVQDMQDMQNIKDKAEHKVDITNLSDSNVGFALPKLDEQNIDSTINKPDNSYIMTDSVNTGILNNGSNYVNSVTDQETNQENTLVYNLPNINLPETKTTSELQLKPSSYEEEENIPNMLLIYSADNTKPEDQISTRRSENLEPESIISRQMTANLINDITQIIYETKVPKIENNKNEIYNANILNQVVGNNSDVTDSITPIQIDGIMEINPNLEFATVMDNATDTKPNDKNVLFNPAPSNKSEMTPEPNNINNNIDFEMNESDRLKDKSDFVTIDNNLIQNSNDTTENISNMQLIHGTDDIKLEDQISPNVENLESKNMILRKMTAHLITKPNQTENNENRISYADANSLNQAVANNSDVNNSLTPVQMNGFIDIIPNIEFTNIMDDTMSTKPNDNHILLNPVPSNEVIAMTPNINNIENITDLENEINGLKTKSNFVTVDNNLNQNTDNIIVFSPSTPPPIIIDTVQDILVPNIAQITSDTEPKVTVTSGTINNKEIQYRTYATNLHDATIPSIVTKEVNENELSKLSPKASVKSQVPCYKFVNLNHYNFPNFDTNMKKIPETYAHNNNLKTQPYNNKNYQLFGNRQYPHIHPWNFLQNGDVSKQNQSSFQSLNQTNNFDTLMQWPNKFLHPINSGLHGHKDLQENKLYYHDLISNINQAKNLYTLGSLKYVQTPNTSKPLLSKYKNIVTYLEPVASKKAESILDFPQVNPDNNHNQNPQIEIFPQFRKESLLKTLDNSKDYEVDRNQIGITLSDKSKEHTENYVNYNNKPFDTNTYNTISSPTTLLPYYPYNGKKIKSYVPYFGSNAYYVLDPCAYKNILTLEGYDKPTVEISNTPATPQDLTDKGDTLLGNYNALPSRQYIMAGFVPTNGHLHIPTNIPLKLNTNALPINQYYNIYLSNLSQAKHNLTPLTSKIDLANKNQYAISTAPTKPIESFTAVNNVLKIEDGVTNNVLQKDYLIEPIIKYVNEPQILECLKSITPETIPLRKLGSNDVRIISQPHLQNYKPLINSKPFRTSFDFSPSKSKSLLNLKGVSQPDQTPNILEPYGYYTVAPKTEPLAQDLIKTGFSNNINAIPIGLHKDLLQNVSPTALNPYNQKVKSSSSYPSSTLPASPMAAYYPFSSVAVIPPHDITPVSHHHNSLLPQSNTESSVKTLFQSKPGFIEQRPYTSYTVAPKTEPLAQDLIVTGLPNNFNAIPIGLNKGLLQNVSPTVLNPYIQKVKSSLPKFISPTITDSTYPSSSFSVTPMAGYHPFSSVSVIPLQDITTVSHGDLSTNSLLPESPKNKLFPSKPGFFEQRPYTSHTIAPKTESLTQDLIVTGLPNNFNSIPTSVSKASLQNVSPTQLYPYNQKVKSSLPKFISPTTTDSTFPSSSFSVTPMAGYHPFSSVPVSPLQDITTISHGDLSTNSLLPESSVNKLFPSKPGFYEQRPYISHTVAPKTESLAQDLIVAGLPNNFNSIPTSVSKASPKNLSPTQLNPYNQKVKSSVPKFISPTITDSTYPTSSFSVTPIAGYHPSSSVPVIPLQDKTIVPYDNLSTNSLMPLSISESFRNSLLPYQTPEFFEQRPYKSKDKYAPRSKFISYLFPPKEEDTDKQNSAANYWNIPSSNLEPFATKAFPNENIIGTSSVLSSPTTIPAKHKHTQLLSDTTSFKSMSGLEALVPSKQSKTVPYLIQEAKDTYKPYYSNSINPTQPSKASSNYVTLPYNIMPLAPYRHHSKIPAFYETLPVNPMTAYYPFSSVPDIPLQHITAVSSNVLSSNPLLFQSSAYSSTNTLFPCKSTPGFFEQSPYTSHTLAPKTEPLARDLIVTGLPNNFNSIPIGLNKASLQNVSPTVLNPYSQKVKSSLPKFISPTIAPTITDSSNPSSSFSITPMAAYYPFSSTPVVSVQDETIVPLNDLSTISLLPQSTTDSSISTFLPCHSTPETPYIAEDKYEPKSKLISYLFPPKQEFSNKQRSTADSQNNYSSNLESLASNTIPNKNMIDMSSVLPLSITMPAKHIHTPLLRSTASVKPIFASEGLLTSKQSKTVSSLKQEDKDTYKPTPCYSNSIMPMKPLKATSSYASWPFSTMPLTSHHHSSKIPFYKALPHNVVTYVNEFPSNSIFAAPERSILTPAPKHDIKSSKDTLNYPHLSPVSPINAKLSSTTQSQSTFQFVPYSPKTGPISSYGDKYSTLTNPLSKSRGTNILVSQNFIPQISEFPILPEFLPTLSSLEKPRDFTLNLDTKYTYSPFYQQLTSKYDKRYESQGPFSSNYKNIPKYGLPGQVTYTEPTSFHQTPNIGSAYAVPKLAFQSNLPTISKLGLPKSPILSMNNLSHLKPPESYNTLPSFFSGYKTDNLANNKMFMPNLPLYSQSEIVSTPKSSDKMPYSAATSNSILPGRSFETSFLFPNSPTNKLNKYYLQDIQYLPNKTTEISLSEVTPSDLTTSPNLVNGTPLSLGTESIPFDLTSISHDNLPVDSSPSGYHSHVTSPLNFSPNKFNNVLSSLLPYSKVIKSKNEEPSQNLTPTSSNTIPSVTTAINTLIANPPSASNTGLPFSKSISKPKLQTPYLSPCFNGLPSNMYYAPEFTKRPLETYLPALTKDHINTRVPNLSFSNFQDSQQTISPLLNPKNSHLSPMVNDKITWANLDGKRKITPMPPFSYPLGIKSNSVPLQSAFYPLPSPSLAAKVSYPGPQIPLSLTGYSPLSSLTTPFIQKPNFIQDVTDSTLTPTYTSSVPTSTQIPTAFIGYPPFSSLTTPPPFIQKPNFVPDVTDSAQTPTYASPIPSSTKILSPFIGYPPFSSLTTPASFNEKPNFIPDVTDSTQTPTYASSIPSSTQIPSSLAAYSPFSSVTTPPPFIQKPNFIPDVTYSTQTPTYASSIPSSTQIPSSLAAYSPFSSVTTPPPFIQKPNFIPDVTYSTQTPTYASSIPSSTQAPSSFIGYPPFSSFTKPFIQKPNFIPDVTDSIQTPTYTSSIPSINNLV